MSTSGHLQSRYNRDKNHAIVGRSDERLPERRHERFDPITIADRGMDVIPTVPPPKRSPRRPFKRTDR